MGTIEGIEEIFHLQLTLEHSFFFWYDPKTFGLLSAGWLAAGDWNRQVSLYSSVINKPHIL